MLIRKKDVKRVKTGLMQIRGTIERAALNEENRTVPILFSSETPVEEWFGFEILDHAQASIRMDRAKNGLPLLWTHDTSMMTGRVQDITFATDRVGRGIARFGKSPLAEEKFQDVKDGIITDVSVAARRYRTVLQEQGADGTPSTYRTVDWEPLHVALCATGADPRAGVGRETTQENWLTIEETIKREVNIMKFCPVCGKELVSGACPDGHELTIQQPAARSVTVTDPPKPPIDIAAIRLEGGKAEATRVMEIIALGEAHKCPDLAREAIKAGDTVDAFKTKILETQYKAKPVQTDLDIGMSKRDMSKWSVLRAIEASISKNWALAPFEKECSDAVEKQIGKRAQGFFIPFDVQRTPLVQRDLVAGTWTAGGATVATDLLSSSFIELLRNKMMVRTLGATILGGLVGDVAIPGQAGSATSYWVAESGAPTESQQLIGQIALTPKTVGAFTDISRKLLLQSSIDVEAFVRNDLAQTNALAIDLAAINGRGVGGQPLGILNRVAPTGTVGITAMGVNGAAVTFAAIIGMESGVASNNADVGSMAYLTNAVQRGTLKALLKNAAAATFVWENNSMNGYPAYVSNQVPSNLQKGTGSNLRAILFGVWSQLLIGEWGTVDVLVDPYTGGAAGTVRVRILQSVDVSCRHEESFHVIKDAV